MAMPLVMRLGLGVLALGVFADLVAHAGVPGAASGTAAGVHTGAQLSAHFVVFVGMVLTVLGVVVDGVQRSRARRSAGRPPKGVA